LIDSNLEWILEDVIRKNYREGLFVGELPGHWSEDDVVDYAMSKFHLKQSSMATGRMGLFDAEQRSMPEWAKGLIKKIDILTEVLPDHLARIRKAAKTKKPKGEDLDTEEEKQLKEPEKYPYLKDEEEKPSIYPKPYREHKKYPYEAVGKGTVSFFPRGKETKQEFIDRVTQNSNASEEQAEDLWNKNGGSVRTKTTPDEEDEADKEQEKKKLRGEILTAMLEGLNQQERKAVIQGFVKRYEA
jgi:hypothetical protein